MESIRRRAMEIFPSVLLTVLSMVQALALELLWTRLGDSPYLWEGGWDALLGWAQVVAVLLGLLEIWLFYISLVIRMTWLPSAYDSVLPFAIGILEFTMIELMGPESLAPWLYTVALLFALAIWTGHWIARRARLMPSNWEAFVDVEPATYRDFLPSAAAAGLLIALGMALQASGERGILALVAIAIVIILIAWQTDQTRRFWKRSLLAAPADEGDLAERESLRPGRDREEG
ncbi:MAG: hypothetical protein QGI26_10390 [Myxococcota bacterium]|jgi:hypothetical protein|nr:hypothetical protein [Myxococcota bacterium]